MSVSVQHASNSLHVPNRECFPRSLIDRRMIMEALRRTQSGPGQSTSDDCSVRTVARSGKCHAVGSREKWRRDGEREGDGEEVECLIRCSSRAELGGESFRSCYRVGTMQLLTAT